MAEAKITQAFVSAVEKAKASNRAASKRYHATHREERKARAKLWRELHREKLRERQRRWRETHREQDKASKKRWDEGHKDQKKAYAKAHSEQSKAAKHLWRERHLEQARQSQRRWNKANPEKCRAIGETRRARKRGAPGRFTAEQIRALYEHQQGRCANLACNKKLREDLKGVHRDHHVPLSKGGTNHIDNIDLLCAQCNRRKHAKSPETWARENGVLF